MHAPHEIRGVHHAGLGRGPAWHRMHRRLASHLTARLVGTPVAPSQVSGMMMLMGILGAACCASARLGVNAVGWLCLFVAILLDRVDGDLARRRQQESLLGILLGRLHHRLVEPLLFLAVGFRAWHATASGWPLLAALAAMLAANVIDETRQLPAAIAARFARETGRWPAAGRGPSRWLASAADGMRVLDLLRTHITLLPIVIAVTLLEAATGRPMTTLLLLEIAAALGIHALFEVCFQAAGQLEADVADLASTLPAPERATIEPVAREEVRGAPPAEVPAAPASQAGALARQAAPPTTMSASAEAPESAAASANETPAPRALATGAAARRRARRARAGAPQKAQARPSIAPRPIAAPVPRAAPAGASIDRPSAPVAVPGEIPSPASAPAPAAEAAPAAVAAAPVSRAGAPAWPLPRRASPSPTTAAADPQVPRQGAAHAGAAALAVIALLLAPSGSATAATLFVNGIIGR